MADRANLSILLITAALLLGILSTPTAFAVVYSDFPAELQLILDERIAEIDAEGGMCIAGQVSFSDGAPITSGADVMVNFYEGWDEPLWVYEGGWFIMGRVGPSSYAGPDKGFVLRAFGYDPIDASVTILDDEMTYLEFEITKTLPENLANIEGSVYDGSGWYDGSGGPWQYTWYASVSIYFPFANHGPGTYPYMSRYATYGFGHGGGEFSFEDLSVCEHEVMATAENYEYHIALVTPPAVGSERVTFKIYPNRAIVIDYVYQADGSRDFTGGDLQTGTIEWLNGSGGVDFSQGQVLEGDSQDLSMVQEADILRFEAIDPNGLNGFYDAGLVDLDSVFEAAEADYTKDSQLSKVGHVYVVQTGEGNYAKFFIQSFERAARAFSSPDYLTEAYFDGYGLFIHTYCYYVPGGPPPSCTGPDSVAVRKFCAIPSGLEGQMLPYIWEVNGWDGPGPYEEPGLLISIRLTYDEGDVASVGLSEDELTLFQSPDNGAGWHRLETARDESDNTLVVVVDRLSWFVVGSESTEILPRVIYVDDDASAPPDPCEPGPWPWPYPLPTPDYYHGDGATWETAYKYLTDAFESANTGDEIRVAGGTYRPDIYRRWYGWSKDRNATFQLKNGVAIYGGYAGIGALDPDERNFELYESILTGDLDENDGPTWNYGENSYHVVTASGTEPNAILDGFTITRGLADGFSPEPTYHGGGMYNDNGSPTLVNCIFERNYARRSPGLYNCNGSDPNIINCTFTNNLGGSWLGGKGALYNENSNPVVTNCTFTENFNGGMYNEYSNVIVTNCLFTGNEVGGMGNGNSSPIVTDCIFTDNDYGMNNWQSSPKVINCTFTENVCGMSNGESNPMVSNCTFSGNSNMTDRWDGEGGGMWNYQSNPVVTDCNFIENSADYGGGMYNDGDMYNDIGSRPLLTNCMFIGNSAYYGGAMCNGRRERSNGSINKPVLINCIFRNNSADRHGGRYGGGMYNWYSDPNLTNCEFTGNWAREGGAICNERDCTLSMVNCTFTGNSAQDSGGAIQNGTESDFWPRSRTTLTNCGFVGNWARTGGGIGNYGGILNLIECTFNENLSYPGGWGGGGGGIANHDYGIATVDKCTFSENISRDENGRGGLGGAIANYQDLLVTNSIFIDNVVSSDLFEIRDETDLLDTGVGGAVYSGHNVSESNVRIDSCLFTGNSAGLGGGLCLEGGHEPEDNVLVNNCTIVGNSARYYGGGLLLDVSVEVTNCIIRDNRAVLGPQVTTWAWEVLESRISYCDVQGGEEEVFIWDIWGETSIDWGEGNIDADPCFVEAGWWDPNGTPTDPNDDFWVDGDYHLQPTSPCIDVGDNSAVDPNSTDFDGNPRIVDGNDDDDRVVDMGAYEYWKYARNLADLNGDGVVDYRDFVLLASNWMEENCPVSAWCGGCDLNYSGKVDSIDLFRVARSWLWQIETAPDLDFDLDNLWMYQNLPGRTVSNLTAAVSIAYDPLNNSSYTYDWEFILPDDVTIAPAITNGGGVADSLCTFAAPDCNQPGGISDSGQTFTVRVTVTGADYGNSAQAEAQFGIALLGDVNNDTGVNVTDRIIMDTFWRTGSAEPFTFRDCDIDCNGYVNVVDRIIASEIWRGKLGSASVTTFCPFR